MQTATSSTERSPLVQPTYVFESSLARRYQKRLHNMQCALCVFIIAILIVALLVTISYNLSLGFDDDTMDDTTTIAPLPGNLTLLQMFPGMATHNLTLLAVPSTLQPLMKKEWPLKALALALLVKMPYNLSLWFDDDTIEDTTTIAPLPDNLTLLQMFPGMAIHNLTLLAVPSTLQPLMKKKWPLKGRATPKWAAAEPSKKDITSAVLKGKVALADLNNIEKKRAPLSHNTPAIKAQWAVATPVEIKPMAEAAYVIEEATKALANGMDVSQNEGGIGQGPDVKDSFPLPPYCVKSATPCPESKYRSIDGTCNNLEHPLRWGVAKTPFRRVLPADYADGISAPRVGVNGSDLPSARDVSVTIHRPSYAHDSTFTVMLAVWGQFLDHDITATALSKGANGTALSCCDTTLPEHPACFPVELDVEDPFYQDYNITCMEFVRAAPATTCKFGPRQQLNQATSFIDGSVVYGVYAKKTTSLRAATGGLLKMLKIGPTELLPQSTNPNDSCNTAEMNAKGRYCFETGDDRANENLHLTTMHLIWARQHNRLATLLRVHNPDWDDETVFQESRKIVSAQMQHITYTELLPNLLGVDVMWALNITVQEEGFSDMYDPTVDPSVANHFAAAAFRFAHTLLPGLIHNANKATGTVQYVQLHQMLFNPFALYSPKGTQESMRSAMNTLVHTVDPHVTKELSEHLFENPQVANASVAQKPGPCGLDLVSLNIQRGRDHGLPAYPMWREHCGFPRPKSFDDLKTIFDESSFNRIDTIYKSVDDIDLYTGALAEDPKGRLLGPTLTCLIADQFLRLKVGDRFWYETSNSTVGFTIEQLTEIRKTTLASVICANEELLDQAQPRVMEAVSPTNPLVDCMELPQPSLKPWKEVITKQ